MRDSEGDPRVLCVNVITTDVYSPQLIVILVMYVPEVNHIGINNACRMNIGHEA